MSHAPLHPARRPAISRPIPTLALGATLTTVALAACSPDRATAPGTPAAGSAALTLSSPAALAANGKIAFARYDTSTGAWDVHVMNADGTSPRNLTAGSSRVNLEPAWSPDGTKIAFASDRDGASPGSGSFFGLPVSDIYVLDLATGALTRLTTHPDADVYPAWSPDGTKIAFTSARDRTLIPADPEAGHDGGEMPNLDIYVMEADGSDQTRLTSDPTEDLQPAWQPVPVAVTFPFGGFLQPVDNLPALNKANAGSAIPVKFSLGGDRGLGVLAGAPTSAGIACALGQTPDPIEQTASVGRSGLTYDAATDTYTYAWVTDKAWASSCRRLTVRLSDGTEHQADFQFTK